MFRAKDPVDFSLDPDPCQAFENHVSGFILKQSKIFHLSIFFSRKSLRTGIKYLSICFRMLM